ncbi:MAG: glycosyltransferase family 2 protein [Thermoplasmatota archaeon]
MLTLNEAANIEACLGSLARQTDDAFEVIVIDAGSTDATVACIERIRPTLPFPIHLHVGPHRMPIGEARNFGVTLAQSPLIAFLSADAELEPGWVGRARVTLRSADMAFGPQVHAPHRWTVGAAVRGLRYQFPGDATSDPLRFASNVAAAYRRPVLDEFPFDPWANAAEDLLLAHRASAAGYIAAYDPGMVARHHDVSSLRQELRKNVREGRGCGLYARELGVQWPVLAWFGLLGVALLSLLASVGIGLVLLGGALWLPAARRGLRRRQAMPARHLWAGMVASPAFDLVFLVQYVRGLAGMRRPAAAPLPVPQEIPA